MTGNAGRLEGEERLRAAITAKLQAMIAQNQTRVGFLEKFRTRDAGSLNSAALRSDTATGHVRSGAAENDFRILTFSYQLLPQTGK
jgi:hypothetical protein